MQFKRMLMSWL